VRRGVIAEYASASALLAAGRTLRAKGFTHLEAYTPHPVKEIDDALAAKRSPLAIAAGLGGLCGALGGYLLQWYLVAHLYPIDSGGRPAHMPLPFLIITIEMGFLFGALAVVAAFFVGARLVNLWDPLFEVPGFESATRDGYWLAVATDDPEVFAGTTPRCVHAFGGAGGGGGGSR